MPALSDAIGFNVEVTLNAWLNTTISAITRPSWLMTLPAFVYNWDEVTATIPCFAIRHLPSSMLNDLQGRTVGTDAAAGRRAMGLMEVSCYVTRNSNPSWQAQLRTMRDLVETAATSARTVQLYDYSTPASPAAAAYKIDLQDVTETPTEADPNPAIQRSRVLIAYSFVFRAN